MMHLGGRALDRADLGVDAVPHGMLLGTLEHVLRLSRPRDPPAELVRHISKRAMGLPLRADAPELAAMRSSSASLGGS